MSKKPAGAMPFRITLTGIEPPIWRLIDVPETYSFWDLHVTIQDSMGWLDYHLHSFNPPRRHGRIKSKEPSLQYPLCVDGRRACPPEDCGGIGGYEELLEALAESSHEEHEWMVEWLKAHARNYWPYKPDEFEPASVKFDNPKKQFKIAFSQR